MARPSFPSLLVHQRPPILYWCGKGALFRLFCRRESLPRHRQGEGPGPLVGGGAGGILAAMTDVTRILSRHRAGRPARRRAAAAAGLRRAAQAGGRRSWPRRSPARRSQATALVHEAYLRLVGRRDRPSTGTAAATSSPPPPRPCAASSSSSARRKQAAQARRRPAARRPRPERPRRAATPADDLLALDEALDRLAAHDPDAAELVKLRFFAG